MRTAFLFTVMSFAMLLVVSAGLLAWWLLGVFSASEGSPALAAVEANFRSRIGRNQALYLIIEHFRREPPGSPYPEVSVEETYATLDNEGFISREVTFNRQPDGRRIPTRAIVGRHVKIYGPDGRIEREIDYPLRLPFDLGYSALRAYVERFFPTTITEAGGSGKTVLVSEVSDLSQYPSFAERARLLRLDAEAARIRWEIDETTGLLLLYQETAVLTNGEEVVVQEDKVTRVEIVSMPKFLAEWSCSAGHF